MRVELDAESRQRVEALTRLEASAKSLEEQRSLIEVMSKEMKDTLRPLSSAALKAAVRTFSALPLSISERLLQTQRAGLASIRQQWTALSNPLHESLKKYEEQISATEAKRRQDYGGIEEIKMLASNASAVAEGDKRLVDSAKTAVSGSWGRAFIGRGVRSLQA